MYFVGRCIILLGYFILFYFYNFRFIIGLDFSHESIIVNLLEFIMNFLHKSNLMKTYYYFFFQSNTNITFPISNTF